MENGEGGPGNYLELAPVSDHQPSLWEVGGRANAEAQK
jgi:hypothetical protein